jgi:hypothetical protein
MTTPATNPHDDDAAYEAHLIAQRERMCPIVRDMEDGFDDPITEAYGASSVIADAIARHMRSCSHEWCIDQLDDV